MNRKEFIKRFSLLTAGLATIPNLYANTNNKKNIPGLIKDPDGILDLPRGFTYSILSREGDTMDDGLFVPPSADGMTCIQLSKHKIILIRNHEIGHVPMLTSFFKNNYYGKSYEQYKEKNADKFYDIKNNETYCFGGTTSIVYNTKKEQVEIKDDGLTETQQQSTLDKSTTERPSWLPEKFESAEDMAKS